MKKQQQSGFYSFGTLVEARKQTNKEKGYHGKDQTSRETIHAIVLSDYTITQSEDVYEIPKNKEKNGTQIKKKEKGGESE